MRSDLVYLFLGLLLLGRAAAGSDSAATSPEPWDGEVRVAGAMRAMMHQGQIGSQVLLAQVLPNPDLYAVGALAELAGEITVVGGRGYLSYPEGELESRTEEVSTSDAGAALLVSAGVPAWQSVVTERPIAFEELDQAVEELAARLGLSLEGRLPFLVEGDFEELQWHVIDGRRLSGNETSHRDHLKAAVRHTSARATGTLVGFYSPNDQGVFTHMGSKTHVHCVVGEPVGAGHVDHVDLPAGVTFKLPGGQP